MSDHRPPLELLESTHEFPGPYQIKAIGNAADAFEDRVVEAVLAELPSADDLEYSVRSTPGGRHVSVTLVIAARHAEQVRAIYGRVRDVEGLTLLF